MIPWFGWVWGGITGFLLGAPLVAIYPAIRWPRVPPTQRQRATRLAKTFTLTAATLIALRLSSTLVWLNVAILGSLYFLYCVCTAVAFRTERWILGTLLLLPILFGYAIGTLGQLALMFIIGDYEPRYEAMIAPGVRCRATGQGNATTPVNLETITLYKRLAPTIERRIWSRQTEWTYGKNLNEGYWPAKCREAWDSASR
jgi:hypothetical protein